MSAKKSLSNVAPNRVTGDEGTYRRVKAPSPEVQLASHLADDDLEDIDPEMDTYDIMMRQLPDPWAFEDDQ